MIPNEIMNILNENAYSHHNKYSLMFRQSAICCSDLYAPTSLVRASKRVVKVEGRVDSEGWDTVVISRVRF